jgi:hypothetical protein
MRVLLRWLADFAWLIYAACGLVALIYIARAISLQRRLASSLTDFERETTAARIGRLWRLAVAFVVTGVALVAVQLYLLPQIPLEELGSPTPTLVGFVTLTPSPTSTATPILGALPTVTRTVPSPPTTPTPAVSPTPGLPVTPTPTALAPSASLNVQLDNVAELIGYDLTSAEVNTSQGLGLTLYWRALEGARAADYWVFTHLMSTPRDVRLIGQHDGVPGGGSRPTTGWTAGEVIADYHQMTFYETDYVGTAEIRVGLYDPATDARVPLEGGSHYVVLPITVTVTGP